MAFIEPLDLRTILLQNLAGSAEIFSFIGIIFIAGLGAFFRMSGGTLFMMIFLFSLIMSFTSMTMFYLTVLLGSAFAMWAIIKITKN